MSVIVKARLLWVLPLALVGSWMAVRTLAASPASAPGWSAPAVVSPAQPEIRDLALAKMIGRFASAARSQ